MWKDDVINISNILLENVQPPIDIDQGDEQSVQTEAFENIRSKIGGAISRESSLEKRYNMLINSLNKHIWELESDLKTTKTEDITPYVKLLSSLRMIDRDIKPKGGLFQKIGHGIGRLSNI